jgi:pyrroloquinoline quinone (PQQ) biosynthesis protein C
VQSAVNHRERSRGSSPPPATLVDYAASRLRKLCVATGFGEESNDVVRTVRGLLLPWGKRPRGQSGGWVSEISDDNTPFEFSVALTNERADVRVLFEAQAEEPTLAAYRVAGLAQQERIERDFGADLDRFRRVQDLFVPVGMQGSFALWSAVVFSRGQRPSFKVYLNPQAHGLEHAHALVEEGLTRLGLRRAWSELGRTVLKRGHLDELKYFALDLVSSKVARVKVYVRHHEATPDDLDAASSAALEYVPGEAAHFARLMTGSDGPMSARAPFTCSAFVNERGDRPVATTVYVPACAYGHDDAVVRRRVKECLIERGIDSRLYDSVIDGFANRPLDAGVGMQAWTAVRRQRGDAVVTVYLGTEANTVHPPGTVPAPTHNPIRLDGAADIVRFVGSCSLADHPFVKRLHREQNSAEPLWLLITNTYLGTSRHFVRWLATVTSRVEDDRIRSLLARQLNQELGEGDISRAHSVLMQSFLKAIEPLRPALVEEQHLASGERLGERLSAHYMSDDGFEGLGALMAGEICAEQLIRVVGILLQKQPHSFDPVQIAWLTEHNDLEGGHADESRILAEMVPRELAALEAVRRGAVGVHDALWASLDALYAQCFAVLTVPPGRPDPAPPT